MIVSPCCAHLMAKKKASCCNFVITLFFLGQGNKYSGNTIVVVVVICSLFPHVVLASKTRQQFDRWRRQKSTESANYFLCCWFHFILIANGRFLPRWIRVCARCTTAWWTTRNTGKSWQTFMNVRQQGR